MPSKIESSGYRETEQSVRGLRTFAQAKSISELTQRSLKATKISDDYVVRIEERPDGLFDMVVLRRVN